MKKIPSMLIILIFVAIPLTAAQSESEVEIMVNSYNELGEPVEFYVKNNLDEPIYYLEGCFPPFSILGPVEEGSSVASQINRPWNEKCDSFTNIITNEFKDGITKEKLESLRRNPLYMFFIMFQKPMVDGVIESGETKLIYSWDQNAYVRQKDKTFKEINTVPGNNYLFEFHYVKNVKDYKLPIKFSNIILNMFFRNNNLIPESTRSEYFRIGVQELYDSSVNKGVLVNGFDFNQEQRLLSDELKEKIENGDIISLGDFNIIPA